MTTEQGRTLEKLKDYLRLVPDSTAREALETVGADPAIWTETVEEALTDAEPHRALTRPDGGEQTEETPIVATDNPSASSTPCSSSVTTDNDFEETSDTPEKTPEREATSSNDTQNSRSAPLDSCTPSGSRTVQRLNQQTSPENGDLLVNGGQPTFEEWEAVEFSRSESNTYPPMLLERTQWMGRLKGEKIPFAPWADRDHPEVAADEDARYKWGLEANYIDGDSIVLGEEHGKLNGRVFIQLESDSFAFVDGDDVRDPETGDVHPAFIAILEQLGATFADVSTSGTGVHAYYHAPDGLPIDGKGQATFDIDTEPWGSNDAPPTVEIYANKHVNITTGEKVVGTAEDLNRWDDDSLRAILLANGYEDQTLISHDTGLTGDTLDAYDPDATDPDDTANDIRDVMKAVQNLDPSDLPLSTGQTGTDSTGWITWDPSYRSSESGTSLHYNGDGVFHDHKEGESFGVLSLFAAECPEVDLTNPWDRFEGSDWWDAIEAARNAGAPIPQYQQSAASSVKHTPVLPAGVRDLTTVTSGWDWQHTSRQSEDSLTVSEARERTQSEICDAYRSRDETIIEALPSMGKSYGCISAAAETGQQITVLTGRGRKEQYEQYIKWCEEFDLDYYVLPSFTRHCETARGDYDEELAQNVKSLYNRGVTPKQIHKRAKEIFGEKLPCQTHGEGGCTYAKMWNSVSGDHDVLIGHYSHAHKQKVTQGRTVVFDEFPGASYERTLDAALPDAVSCWLQNVDEIPFQSFTDLIENRDDESRRADALLWFEDNGITTDMEHVFDNNQAYAITPLAVFTLLAGEDLGNGIERAEITDNTVGTYNREKGSVSILQPPSLKYSGVVALDGTPTKQLWELALGERLTHRPVPQPEEQKEYIRDALNLNLVQTTEHVKPYNSQNHVNTEQDAALLEAIDEKHEQRPAVITSSTAETAYGVDGVDEYIAETKHYGNVLGSNEFKETRLGAVIGSNHYGDGYIKKWGGYAGICTERGEGKGSDLSYGQFGDHVLQHMREHDTLQAVMRFGRDGNGAVVYVHTATLPEWVPLAGEGRVIKTWSDGMREVITALEDLSEATTKQIVTHPAVDLSRQQVFDHLESLREQGVLTREQDPTDGRRVVWMDDGIHRLGDHGQTTLERVSLEDLSQDEVRQLTRDSIYMWAFTKLSADRIERGTDSGSTPRALTDGGIPPDDPPSKSGI